MRNVIVGVFVFCLGFAGHGFGDSVGDAARSILSKHGDAVVTVSLVIKESMSGMGFDDEYESTSEILGTVIDPSGLVVVSLSETDPSGMFDSMMGGLGGDDDFSVEGSVEKLNILRPGGEEIPATIVLRDKYLDLAFLRTVEKLEEPLQAVALDETTVAEVFEEVVHLRRLGKVGKRQAAGGTERINAVIAKPRLFYVAGYAYGCPTFTLDGKCLGIVVMRMPAGGASVSASLSGDGDFDWETIILPAVDILESAKQVPPREAAGEE